VSFDEEARWLVLTRGTAAVACNLAGGAQRVPHAIGRDAQILVASGQEVRVVDDKVELPPESVAIFSAADGVASRVRR
jgi:Domain of unknown function (DUF3459)